MGKSGSKVLLIFGVLMLIVFVGIYFLWAQSRKIDSEHWAMYQTIEKNFGMDALDAVQAKNQTMEQYRMAASAPMGGYYLIDFGVRADGSGILDYRWLTPHDFEKGELMVDETKELTLEEARDIASIIESNEFFARPASEFRKKGAGSQMQDVEIVIEGYKGKKHNALYGRVLMEKSPVFAIAEAMFFFTEGVETPFWRDKAGEEEGREKRE